MNQAVLLAFGSSFCFAVSSVAFARFSREISPAWMNTVKALVCAVALGFTLVAFGLIGPITPASQVALALSGGVGLGIGDMLLLGAYARIGASRTLLVFGFQPLVMAFAGHFLFGQELAGGQVAAIGFFLACLFILSFEGYRREGHWELRGLILALGGVLLDNLGVILTRWAFEASPTLNAFQANLFRVGGALAVYAAISMVRPINVVREFKRLKPSARMLALGASLTGTYVTLSLYLTAVKIGHLATISALVLTGPLYSAALECLLQRKPPSAHLISAFVCLVGGMGLALGFF